MEEYQKIVEQKEIKKRFLSCTIFKDKLYFISEADLILMKMNLLTNKIEYIDNPVMDNTENLSPLRWKLADRMMTFGENIYVLESCGKRMIQYNVAENKYRYFDISCEGYICDNYAAFTIYKDKAYIFPSFFNEVVIVDLISGDVTHKKEFCADILYVFNNNDFLPTKMFSCGCRIKDTEWIFMERNGEVVEYHLETGEYYRHKIPNMINGCVQVEWKDNLFYILDLKGKLYTWDIQTENVKGLLTAENNLYPEYLKMAVTDEKIWLLPNIGKDIISIDKKTKRVEKLLNYPTDFHYFAPEGYSKYFAVCEDAEKYYFSMHSGNYIFTVRKKSGKEEWVKPIFPIAKDIFDYYEKNQILISEKGCCIHEYIGCIKQKNNINKKQRSSIGKQIWEKAKRI